MIRTQVRRQIQIRKHANNSRSLAFEIERILPARKPVTSTSYNRQNSSK